MKIKKLRMQAFRNHVDSTIDCQDATFLIVRGANGSGKSSIAQAISIVIAETTMGLAVDGTGYRSKIRNTEKQATLVLEVQGQHILEKSVTLNVGAGGRTQTVKCIDVPDDKKAVSGLENFLSRYKSALRIAVNTDAFVKLDDKEQKSLLAKLVLPSRYDFPKENIDAANGLLDSPIDFNDEPFLVIETAYRQLYKLREAVNRDVKNFVIPDALPIPKGVDSESLQKELTAIRAEREKLQKERDAAVAKANEVEVQRATLQTTRENLLKKRDEDQKKLAAAELSILSDADVIKLKAVETKASELEELKKTHAAYLGGIRAVNDQIDKLRSISDKGAICPTCDQDIDSGKIDGLIAELKKEIVQGDKSLQALDTKIEAIGDIESAKASLKKHEDAVKAKEELTKALTDTVTEGKKTRAALDALSEKKDATLPFHNPLEILQTKEDGIIAQLTPVITAEQRAKDVKTKTEAFEKLEVKAKTLQDLVVYFDKDGIKKKLIADHIGSFEAKLNSVLNAWGYKASLSSDLSSFDVTTPRGYKGPVKEMSGAEEHIFKAAFQCAVSSAAGIKLVVIDEVEEIGIEIRQHLYLSVFQLIQSGALDQAILIGYSLDKTVPNPKAPGSRYFFVENGEVEVLG